MIELPDSPAPNGMEPELLDYGFVQRGASSLRVDRPGSRYRITFSFPPMTPDNSRKFIARLQRAKREGLRIDLPLLVAQGVPGSPVVDGAGQAGSTIAVRGLTPHYAAKEGYWLTITAVDGTAYLHNVSEPSVADASGEAIFEIEPPLRAPFADGDEIEMGKPFVQGFVDGDSWGWQVPVNKLVALGFTLEEFA